MKEKFKLEKVYFGKKSKFFTIQIGDNKHTLLEEFMDEFENNYSYMKIINRMLERIRVMADLVGIKNEFFKEEGPNSVYRFNSTKNLRLYCLKYGKFCVIAGGGGIKSKKVNTFQETKVLYDAVKILREVDKSLFKENIDFTRVEKYLSQEFEMEWPL